MDFGKFKKNKPITSLRDKILHFQRSPCRCKKQYHDILRPDENLRQKYSPVLSRETRDSYDRYVYERSFEVLLIFLHFSIPPISTPSKWFHIIWTISYGISYGPYQKNSNFHLDCDALIFQMQCIPNAVCFASLNNHRKVLCVIFCFSDLFYKVKNSIIEFWRKKFIFEKHNQKNNTMIENSLTSKVI